MRTPLAATLAITLAFACTDQPAPTALNEAAPAPSLSVGPVIHHVSVGSPDACAAFGLPPGCDANFSLVANLYADGSVTGQYQDTFAGGFPVHIIIDCLNVVGNEAWVSGVSNGPILFGIPTIARVVDNGRSANDPADQISFTSLDEFGGCQAAPDLQLFDLSSGQVLVR